MSRPLRIFSILILVCVLGLFFLVPVSAQDYIASHNYKVFVPDFPLANMVFKYDSNGTLNSRVFDFTQFFWKPGSGVSYTVKDIVINNVTSSIVSASEYHVEYQNPSSVTGFERNTILLHFKAGNDFTSFSLNFEPFDYYVPRNNPASSLSTYYWYIFGKQPQSGFITYLADFKVSYIDNSTFSLKTTDIRYEGTSYVTTSPGDEYTQPVGVSIPNILYQALSDFRGSSSVLISNLHIEIAGMEYDQDGWLTYVCSGTPSSGEQPDNALSWAKQRGIIYSKPVPINDVDYSSWLSTAIGGFFSFELFPGFTLAGVLAVIIGFSIFIWILKIFAGG